MDGTGVNGYTYHYDQLNRLKKMRRHPGITGTSWNSGSITQDYQENASYDGNGNILTYGRNGAAPTAQTIDSLTYNYNRDTKGRLTDNKLKNINDAVVNSLYTGDLTNQTNTTNYRYDAIGNLIYDAQSGITGNDGVNSITWSVYGKIQNIYKTTGTISYTYNPAGERVNKTAGGLTTWYVRDAQGNTLATYDNAHSTTNWKEQQLYGSSRLGMWTPGVDLTAGVPLAVWDTVGHKQYELNNHLGNVLETVTEKRLQHATSGSLDYYLADIATAQEYYPFGMLMPGRQTATANYRYGFNGKENDNEVKGLGNEQDYGMRIYDPRVGRFLSTDPISKSYPELTPYQFASNNPILNIDIDGLEGMASNYPIISPDQAQTINYNVHTSVTDWLTKVEDTYDGTIRSWEFATGQPASIRKKSQALFSALLWHGEGNVTHVDDVSVLKNGKHADGSPANWLDKGVSGTALFVPLVGGQFLKKGGSALIEGVIDVFKNGERVEETAYKIGNYGFKGTKAFNEVIGALRKGGNFVVSSEEDALKLLKEAFPEIKQDASGAASAFGYRIDREAEEATTGSVKQGHTGTHINYYNKKTKVRGSITIEPTKKGN